jgi:hypothetical protein
MTPYQNASAALPSLLQASMLTDKIRLSGPESDEPEDILSSSLGVIFPDDITNRKLPQGLKNPALGVLV